MITSINIQSAMAEHVQSTTWDPIPVVFSYSCHTCSAIFQLEAKQASRAAHLQHGAPCT